MIKIPDSVLKFSDNVDLFKAWGDYFNHYRVINHGKKKDYDTSMTFEEKDARLNKAIRAEVNKIVGKPADTVIGESVWATNPQYRWAAFAIQNVLIDMVIPDVIMDAYGQFSEVRNLAWGDSSVFDILSSDLFYVSKNGNNRRHITAQKQFTGQTSLIPENRSITVQTDLYRVLCGKESYGSFAAKIAISMEAEIAKDIYAALSDSFDSLHAKFKESGFTQTSFLELNARVGAANSGSNTTCFATNIALGNLLPTSDYLKMNLGEQYNRLSFLPIFLGVPLISLPQKLDWTDADYGFAIRNDEVFCISGNSQSIVKVVTEGNTLAVEDAPLSNANLTQDLTLHKRWKVGIVTNSKYGIIRL